MNASYYKYKRKYTSLLAEALYPIYNIVISVLFVKFLIVWLSASVGSVHRNLKSVSREIEQPVNF